MSDLSGITTPTDVLEVARCRTGLNDIDSQSWEPGLALVLDEVLTSPVFTPQGRQRILNDCVEALGRRLTVHGYIQAHPEVLHQQVERPLITLGMPRTGTTVISYLLDQDPRRRSLLYWECMQPVPPPTAATLRTDPRCQAMLAEQAGFLKAVKEANMTLPHWEDADGPTEDMFIHNQDFQALSWDAYLATSRYADWLINEADMTSTYEYQKRYLQVLQSKAPGTWSLKMPSHSVHIESLLKVFPDARLVWAHRDPYKATASLVGNLWALPKNMTLNPDAMDREAMGHNAMRQMKAHVERPLRVRDRLGDEHFFHIFYHEMMADPMAVMRKLYAWAGDELTPDVEARMRRWLAEHPQDRFGRAQYKLAEYGLSVQMLEPIFAEYLQTFDIELEGCV